MTIKDLPKYSYVKTVNTGEEILLGAYKQKNHTEVAYMNLYIFIEGGQPTLETMKIEVHRNAAGTMKAFESNTISLSDILNPSPTRWKGWVRFDFNRQNMNKNFYYFPKLIIANYTRTPTYYISTELDWPIQSNPSITNNPIGRAMKLEIKGYE
jgi:hypothetical protein